MPKFTCHTSALKGTSAVFFTPGQDVPGWALPLVGDHVHDGGKTKRETTRTKDTPPAGKDTTGSPTDDGQPDFTAPAKPARKKPRTKK